ncbi:hypothetical protein [Piscinibacter sp. XHJ-5]|uniref:hypothetical protein n=1 Tax=Piscinibacter sp. XHJ-5 TaxID=3037797 RepID=UPI0024535FE4|nr:hypothetical protein [Piscinibacter sp. XHJ-5]
MTSTPRHALLSRFASLLMTGGGGGEDGGDAGPGAPSPHQPAPPSPEPAPPPPAGSTGLSPLLFVTQVPIAASTARSMAAGLGRWIGTLWFDPRSRYPSCATDHVDLERRQRAWDANVRQHASMLLRLP